MNDLSTPHISVVMPTYNSSHFVAESLASIFAQTIKPFEIIIVDDGSTDETCRVIADMIANHDNHSIQFVQHAHCGPGAARNIGIRKATGEWIAFIDSDDIWMPNKLERVQQTIQANRDYDFFCHAEEHLQLNGRKLLCDYGLNYKKKKNLTVQLYQNNLFSTSAVICKKKLLIEKGLFDEALLSGQDYELWLRLSPNIKPFFIREVLGMYVHRKGNITTTHFFRRWKNQHIIAMRYCGRVGVVEFFRKVFVINALMLVNAVRDHFEKLLKAPSPAGEGGQRPDGENQNKII